MSQLVPDSLQKTLITVATIFSAGFFVSQKLSSKFEDLMKPLVERVLKLEDNQKLMTESSFNLSERLNSVMYQSEASYICLNTLTGFINHRFHTEFVKPEEIYIKTKKGNGN